MSAIPSPGLVWMDCPKCGERFGASPHAIAEGRDVCKDCQTIPFRKRNKNHTATVNRNRFQKLYKFYLAFWEWWNNRNFNTEFRVLSAYASFTKCPAAILRTDDALNLEKREWEMLLILKDRWIEWRNTQSSRSYTRLFYAFHQLDWYYEGSSGKNAENEVD